MAGIGSSMILLAGADVVLPDRLISPGTVVIEGDRILEVVPGRRPSSAGSTHLDLQYHYIVPGFIDIHVHGLESHDVHDVDDVPDAGPAQQEPRGIAAMAARLPRYGVVAFCPTTMACTPPALQAVLGAVRQARTTPPAGARVLPAHVESGFLSPDFRGAQPVDCLRLPPPALASTGAADAAHHPRSLSGNHDYDGSDILAVIEAAPAEVGLVTLAPELAGGLDLVRRLTANGHRVSVGHSGASFDEGLAAVAAGARHATHLFNRMPPLTHREPGLAGAILRSGEVTAEVICDSYHVHPAMVGMTVATKSPSRVIAITDGTAGSGLSVGSRARLGGRPITVRDSGAYLDEGTLAGSVLTMDGALRVLVERVGLTLTDAAVLCATTPARELGLAGHGIIAAGAMADLTVLDRKLRVVQTYIGGTQIYPAAPEASGG